MCDTSAVIRICDLIQNNIDKDGNVPIHVVGEVASIFSTIPEDKQLDSYMYIAEVVKGHGFDIFDSLGGVVNEDSSN